MEKCVKGESKNNGDAFLKQKKRMASVSRSGMSRYYLHGLHAVYCRRLCCCQDR